MKELLEKYLNGTATPEEVKLVDDWYDSRLEGGEDQELSDSERNTLRASYWSRVRRGLDHPRAKERKLWPKISAIAAALVGILVIANFILLEGERYDGTGAPTTAIDSAPDQHLIDNLTKKVRQIALVDGSRVSLFPGSVLGVDNNFDENERKVTLAGRASFEVSRNESKPFYVVTDEVVTKVLGTSFTIDAYPEAEEISVEVSSGAVSVYSNFGESVYEPTGSGVILTPNQQAVYNKNDKRVFRTLVKEPRIIISKDEVNKIRFEGEAVSEIFRTLEKMYGVEIEFDEQIFSTCSLTTAVSHGDLYEKIDIICEITGAQYSVEGTRIVITGEGCD